MLSAREFVWWYNGHPAHQGLPVDLRSVRSVAIVGLGNVALDCARVLLQSPERLGRTDITQAALDQLRSSAVREVHIIGRRGPVQASFTPKELRELLSLPGLAVHVHPPGVLHSESLETELELAGSRIKKRVLEVLRKGASGAGVKAGEGDGAGRATDAGPKELHLRFLSSPTRIEATDSSTESAPNLDLILERQRLEVSPVTGESIPVGTAELEALPVQLILKSIGYRSLPVPGLPFDARRGVVPNHMGQVLEEDAEGEPSEPRPVPGLFVCGWLGRGPTGIIGTNLIDAEQTVESMVRASESWPGPSTGPGIAELLRERGVRFVPWQGWEAIDRAEVEAGEQLGKPREKMVDLAAMVKVGTA